MNKKLIISIFLSSFLIGCGAVTSFNKKHNEMPTGSGALSTYSDYGNEIDFDKEKNIHKLTVYLGGNANCDYGALSYAKPKLDKYMKTNNYSSYTVIEGQYSLFPLSKCELSIKFNK